ncbi:1bae2c16-9ff6-4986-9ef9-389a44e3d112 [Sclerotinia trifoliorum]|uniref:1bae2c16-9ff6-4986-9ef9-389a44e3d112 n=1 Tax=Sclerotinia trifoliorum TaxID=28548 RepID=A0A8H2ZMP6_9HELO|nr:1bae2c16-9ff6-4986-9ef9-389a44e3d112 [Sclerotinia trifoliorum]
MHSFKITAALIAPALVKFATAQYTIDPSSVLLATRKSWCQSQTQTCPSLCLQNGGNDSSTETNTCDPETLNYACICGNGLSPNASEYSLTLPYFICTQYATNCVAACNGDNNCQAACRDDHPCGAQNPTRINTTSSATQSSTGTAGASSTNAVAYTGLGGSTSTSTPKSGAAQMTMDFGKSYGLAVIFAGVFAGFTLVM